MSNLIPFESSKLPAFLQKAAPQVNNDLTANVGTGFPYLSIKGKTFTLIRGDEKKLLTRNVDGDEIAAQSISVVILKANKNFSKVWYAKQYVEGSDAKPDCYSNDGLVPDASVEKPQAKSCANCAKNQWGSRVSDEGKKMKACQDSRRIAIAVPDQLNDPMLLRIPPATLKPLAEYGQMLSKRGVPYNAVVTKIKFEPEAATPKLQFEPVGFLDEAQYAEAEEVANGELVENIVGLGAPVPEIVETAHEAEEAPVEKPKKASKAVEAKPAVTEDEIAEIVEEKPKAEKPKAEPKPVKEVAVDEDLDSLIAELDD